MWLSILNSTLKIQWKQIRWILGMTTHDIHLQTSCGLHHHKPKFYVYYCKYFFSSKGINRWPTGSHISDTRPSGLLALQTGRTLIKIDTDMWVPQFLNTAHTCSQHGSGTSWLTSEWPGKLTVSRNIYSDGSNFISPRHAGPHCHTAKTVNEQTEAAP